MLPSEKEVSAEPQGKRQEERRRGALGLWLAFEDRVLLNLGAMLLAVALAMMLFEALSRALLHESYDWAQEIVRFSVVWSFFLCLSLSARHGYQIRSEMLIERLPPRARHACDVVAAAAGALFSGLLLLAGALHVRQLFRNGMLTESTLDWPLWIVQSVMPLGAALLLVFYLCALWRGLTGRSPFAKTIELE